MISIDSAQLCWCPAHLLYPGVVEGILWGDPFLGVPLQTSSDEVKEQHVIGLNGTS